MDIYRAISFIVSYLLFASIHAQNAAPGASGGGGGTGNSYIALLL